MSSENESSQVPASPAPQSDEAPLRPAPPRRKILIGSQRLAAMDKPESSEGVGAQTAAQEKSPEKSAAPVAAPQAAGSDATAPKAAAPDTGNASESAPNAEASADSSERRGGKRSDGDDRRDRRGKKREPKVDPIKQILASTHIGKVSQIPVPGKRAMSDDLEAEFQQALGDLNAENGLDSLISNESFASAGDLLERDTKIAATVIRISKEDAILDLGNYNQGIVALRQFDEIPELGKKINVMVVRYKSDEGLYEVSLPNAAADVEDWSEIEEGMVVEAQITAQNTGGLECEVCHLRAFMPISQVSLYRVESLDEFVGTRMMAIVTEANPERRNLVISHKYFALRQQEAERKEFMATLKIGDVYDAIVRKIMPFGCFVDLGHGVEGLVHISRLSWGRINNPAEVVSEGQQIRVCLEEIKEDTGKMSFSYRDTLANPWDSAADKYNVGATCTAKVVKIMPFGAFCELEPGVEGLIHISEIAHERIVHVSDALKVGQEIQVQVVTMDTMTRKIGLSMKSLIAPPVKEEPEQPEEQGGDSKNSKGAGKGKKEKPEDLEARPLPKKFRNQGSQTLRGGKDSKSEGDKFGLNW